MTGSNMQKFVALYLVPASVMADWAKTDPEIRKTEEQKMQAAWGKWMADHAKIDSQHRGWRKDQTRHRQRRVRYQK